MKKCMKTEVKTFVPWTTKLIPLILNGVLGNAWVCAQFSAKLAHDTQRLCLGVLASILREHNINFHSKYFIMQ